MKKEQNMKNAPKRPPMKKGVIGRVVKMLFKSYPVLVPTMLLCILFSGAVSSIPSLFTQKIIGVIEAGMTTGDWSGSKEKIIPLIFVLIGLYILSVSYTHLRAHET